MYLCIKLSMLPLFVTDFFEGYSYANYITGIEWNLIKTTFLRENNIGNAFL